MNEFDLIKNYFAMQREHRSDVVQTIGDDAAIVSVPSSQELAITTDTLVANVHFFESIAPYDLGYKSLAVNLSDLAAMGATPAWATLAITLHKPQEKWIQGFCDGFFALANVYNVQLIGGDLTHGPLTITVQMIGFVPRGKGILRSGAKANDLVYVTGTLGNAGLALKAMQHKIQLAPENEHFVMKSLHQPKPRIEIGKELLDLATSAIDVSDGLAADINHILEASQVGALIYVDQIPLSKGLMDTLSYERALECALTSGDDYELCFTIPAEKRVELEQRLASIPCRLTCIGRITEKVGLELRYQNGNQYHGTIQGYQHF